MAKVEKLEDYISIIKNLYAMEGCGALRKIYYRGQSDSAYKLIPSLSHKLEGYVEDEDNYIAFEKDIIERENWNILMCLQITISLMNWH